MEHTQVHKFGSSRLRPAAGAICLALAGCGAGSGETGPTANPPADTIPLALVHVRPAAESVEVEPDAVIEVQFDQPLDPARLGAAALQLWADGVLVEGSHEHQPHLGLLRFAPADRLGLAREYRIELASEFLADPSGNSYTGPEEFGFRVRDGRWSPELRIDEPLGQAYLPQAVLDSRRGALVGWTAHDPVLDNEVALTNRAPNGKDWDTALELPLDAQEGVYLERLQGLGSGRALATVVHWEPPQYRLVALVREPDGSWLAPVDLDSAEELASLDVCTDSRGRALVVWKIDEMGGGYQQLRSVRVDEEGSIGAVSIVATTHGHILEFRAQLPDDGPAHVVFVNDEGGPADLAAVLQPSPGQPWSLPQLLDAINADVRDIDVDSCSRGELMVAWSQDDSIWACRFRAETGWESPQLVEQDDFYENEFPQVCMDDDGGAFVLWVQDFDSVRDDLWSNRYVPGIGWLTPQLVEYESAFTREFHLELLPDGGALAVWAQKPNSTSLVEIWANRLDHATGWGIAQKIGPAPGEVYDTKLAVDPIGNAFLVWRQRPSGGLDDDVWALRFLVGEDRWSSPTRLESRLGLTNFPSLAVDSAGRALVAWSHETVADSETGIFVSLFD